MIFKNLAKEEQPREKLEIKGAGELSTQELLAIVLGKGGKGKDVLQLAEEVVRYLESTGEINLTHLCKISGIGKAKACQILASLEFSRRFLFVKRRIQIKTPLDALPALCHLKYSAQEEFVVLTLDGAHQLIRMHIVTKGLVNQSQIHPRETFYPAIQDNAVSIMVAHNHPSGNMQASESDLEATRRLVAAGETMGIGLLDHLIITRNGYLSIREKHPRCFVL